VTPRQLEEEFSPTEIEDFLLILDDIGQIKERERRKAETRRR
jgi:hypothetical protein